MKQTTVALHLPFLPPSLVIKCPPASNRTQKPSRVRHGNLRRLESERREIRDEFEIT